MPENGNRDLWFVRLTHLLTMDLDALAGDESDERLLIYITRERGWRIIQLLCRFADDEVSHCNASMDGFVVTLMSILCKTVECAIGELESVADYPVASLAPCAALHQADCFERLRCLKKSLAAKTNRQLGSGKDRQNKVAAMGRMKRYTRRRPKRRPETDSARPRTAARCANSAGESEDASTDESVSWGRHSATEFPRSLPLLHLTAMDSDGLPACWSKGRFASTTTQCSADDFASTHWSGRHSYSSREASSLRVADGVDVDLHYAESLLCPSGQPLTTSASQFLLTEALLIILRKCAPHCHGSETINKLLTEMIGYDCERLESAPLEGTSKNPLVILKYSREERQPIVGLGQFRSLTDAFEVLSCSITSQLLNDELCWRTTLHVAEATVDVVFAYAKAFTCLAQSTGHRSNATLLAMRFVLQFATNLAELVSASLDAVVNSRSSETQLHMALECIYCIAFGSLETLACSLEASSLLPAELYGRMLCALIQLLNSSTAHYLYEDQFCELLSALSLLAVCCQDVEALARECVLAENHPAIFHHAAKRLPGAVANVDNSIEFVEQPPASSAESLPCAGSFSVSVLLSLLPCVSGQNTLRHLLCEITRCPFCCCFSFASTVCPLLLKLAESSDLKTMKLIENIIQLQCQSISSYSSCRCCCMKRQQTSESAIVLTGEENRLIVATIDGVLASCNWQSPTASFVLVCVHRILAVLPSTIKDRVYTGALLPSFRICLERSRSDSKLASSLHSQSSCLDIEAFKQLETFFAISKLCIGSKASRDVFVKQLFEMHCDWLYNSSELALLFLETLQVGVDCTDASVEGDDSWKRLASFIFDKYSQNAKLIEADIVGLLGDAAVSFFEATIATLQSCDNLLRNDCAFKRLFLRSSDHGRLEQSILQSCLALVRGESDATTPLRFPCGKYRRRFALLCVSCMRICCRIDESSTKVCANIRSQLLEKSARPAAVSIEAVTVARVLLRCCFVSSCSTTTMGNVDLEVEACSGSHGDYFADVEDTSEGPTVSEVVWQLLDWRICALALELAVSCMQQLFEFDILLELFFYEFHAMMASTSLASCCDVLSVDTVLEMQELLTDALKITLTSRESKVSAFNCLLLLFNLRPSLKILKRLVQLYSTSKHDLDLCLSFVLRLFKGTKQSPSLFVCCAMPDAGEIALRNASSLKPSANASVTTTNAIRREEETHSSSLPNFLPQECAESFSAMPMLSFPVQSAVLSLSQTFISSSHRKNVDGLSSVLDDAASTVENSDRSPDFVDGQLAHLDLLFMPDCAFYFLLPPEVNFQGGINISLWFRVATRSAAPSAENTRLSHLLTVGHSWLMITLSLNCANGELHAKLTGLGNLSFAKHWNGVIAANEWTHLVVSARLDDVSLDDCRVGSTAHAVVFINGLTACDITLGCTFVDPSSSRCCVLLGSSQVQFAQMDIAGALVCYGINLRQEHAMLLHQLGPNCTSLLDTKIRTFEPSLAIFVKISVLHSDVNLTQLLEEREGLIEQIQKAIVASYAAFSVHDYCLYPIQQRSLSAVTNDATATTSLCFVTPEVHKIHACCRLLQKSPETLDDIVVNLGGCGFFLFIFGRTIDLSEDADAPCLALRLLLAGVRRSPLLWHQYQSMHGHNLIVTALQSDRVVKSEALLRELLIASTTLDSASDDCCLSAGRLGLRCLSDADFERCSRTLICDARLLTATLLQFSVWKNSLDVWLLAFDALVRMLSPSNPNAYFNREQLGRTEFLKRFLLLTVEVYQEVGESLPFAFSSMFSKLCSSLLQFPPDAASITCLWDWLFLMHPPSCTYLNYKTLDCSSWAKTNLLELDELAGKHSARSGLSEKLLSVSDIIGKNNLVKLLKDKDCSAKRVLSVYEACCLQRSLANSEAAATLPDIISEIQMPSSPAGVSSMKQASTSSSCVVKVIENIGADNKPSRDDPSEFETGSWILYMRADILNLIAELLSAIPDVLLTRLVGPIVKWEHALILLQHQGFSALRDSCFRLICTMLARFDTQQKARFLKVHGFQLLCNQIAEYGLSERATDHLVSLVVGCPVHLGNGFSLDQFRFYQPDKFQLAAARTLLICFVKTTQSLPVFWNLCNFLESGFRLHYPLAKALIDQQMSEVLVCVFATLGTVEFITSDLCKSGRDVCFDAWHKVAMAFVEHCIQYADAVNHQALVEFFTLLIAKDKLAGLEGQTDQQFHVRLHLCKLLESAIEIIKLVCGIKSAVADGCDDSALPDNSSGLQQRFFRVSRPSCSSSPSFEVTDSRNVLQRQDSQTSSGFFASQPAKSKISGSLANSALSLVSIANSTASEQGKLSNSKILADRLNLLLQLAVDVFLQLDAAALPVGEQFFEYLLYLLLGTVRSCSFAKARRANAFEELLWLCRDKILYYFSYLFLYSLNGATVRGGSRTENDEETALLAAAMLNRQIIVTQALAYDTKCFEILQAVADSSSVALLALNLGLHQLLFCRSSHLDDLRRREVDTLFRHLRKLNQSWLLEGVCSAGPQVVFDDERTWSIYVQLKSSNFLKRLDDFLMRLKQRHQKLAKSISEVSMKITCTVVEEQNVPRKLFIQHSKLTSARRLQAEKCWQQIFCDLCHPETIGYDEASFPGSWSLDFTETPLRERRRLRPSHLGVASKFVKPSVANVLERESRPSPLWSILDSPVAYSSNELQIERFDIHEKIYYTVSATIVTPFCETFGELLLGDCHLFFVGEFARTTQRAIPRKQVVSVKWHFSCISEIYKRWYQLTDTAIELFLENGETFLIAFASEHKREEFVQRLLAVDLPNISSQSQHSLQIVSQWWREGTITNFEYIVQLNKLAGRTYSDLMQYPVFPFVLSDYTSEFLDLCNANSFRDLAKPMAVQDKNMEHHYVQMYKTLEAEHRKLDSELSAGVIPCFGPYNYCSHYSNSGIVLHFLVRLPPFTKMLLEYQDDNFDLPDRTFHSLAHSWRLSSSESTSDFKELTPEFYFLPEFLKNFAGFELGERQNGQSISDVQLPPWVPNGDARLFVLIHRQAFESDEVTMNLHAWIDLIWGYKQSGKSAIDAINVFHPATYFGADQSRHEFDDIQKSALRTMVRTYGQMPKQLFRTPHLPHFSQKECQTDDTHIASVSGLKWGNYVGAKLTPEPILILKQRSTSSIKPAQLYALANNTVLGLPAQSVLIVKYKPLQKDHSVFAEKEVQSCWVVAWGFGDTILRGRMVMPSFGHWTNLVALQNLQITAFCSAPGSNYFFVGVRQGIVCVYELHSTRDPKMARRLCSLLRQVYGHSSEVSAISVCLNFAVFVSGSASGELFVWDLNKFTFVRRLFNHNDRIAMICISPTMGDIASVSLHDSNKSNLVVQTINGAHVRTLLVDACIASICYSAAPEGVSINALVAGLDDGGVLFWDSWTLTVIREIKPVIHAEPVASLCFAHNCLKLYACTATGSVLCWENPAAKDAHKVHRYRYLNPYIV